MGFLPFLLGALLCSTAFQTSHATPVPSDRLPDYPIDEKLDGPTSLFTDALLDLSRRWPSGRSFCRYETEPLQIQMVRVPTAGRRYYVGFKKCMGIKAPLSAVAGVMDDVENYQRLFPGEKSVEVLARERNKVTLAWERKIPIFFVPNVKYQIDYLSVTPRPGVKMYRSQLRLGNRLQFSDALVVIESKGPDLTLYSDYEFYEADFGIGLFGIKAVGSDTIWKESLKGSYLSLLAIRFKAEHGDWDYEQVGKASEAALSGLDLDKSASGDLLD